MFPSHLGRAPGVFRRLKAPSKRKVEVEVLESIENGMPFQSACWDAQVDPEEFQAEMDANPKLANAVQYRRARLEKRLLEDVRKGGKGLERSKAALEILGRSFQSWAPKNNATLAKQFEDALAELEKMLDAEIFEKVVRVFERHS